MEENKFTVQIGRSFIMIIEPEGFNVYRDVFHHKELEFVVGSQSKWFRDSIFTMVKQVVGVWQQQYNPTILKMIQECIHKFTLSKVKREEIILRFIGGLATLSYYIGITQNKKICLEAFMVMDDKFLKPMYYCYVSTRDFNRTEVIAKIMAKITQSKQNVGLCEGSFFELTQVPLH
jgi:hypothetical protein